MFFQFISMACGGENNKICLFPSTSLFCSRCLLSLKAFQQLEFHYCNVIEQEKTTSKNEIVSVNTGSESSEKIYYICSKCLIPFDRECDLYKHELDCGNPPIICNACFKLFKTSQGYNTHVSQKHKKFDLFYCPMCQSSFIQFEHLTHHLNLNNKCRRVFN